MENDEAPIPSSILHPLSSSGAATPSPQHLTTVILANDPAEARCFQDRIEDLLKANHFTDCEVFGIKISVHEALCNALKHGNHLDRGKKIHISYRILPDLFEISITDEGPGFDPTTVPDCRAMENLERPCGRGLMMMRHYMTEVAFNERGNSLSMKKVRQAGVRGQESGVRSQESGVKSRESAAN